MRILHLANHCDAVGNGIMNVAVDLACRQADLGHCLAFASAGGAYVPLIEQHGVRHFAIAQQWKRPWTLPGALYALHRLIGNFRPEIVHAHMMTGAVLARSLGLGGRFRLVTTVHNEWQKTAIVMGIGDRVIAVSDAVRVRMQQRGVPSRKLRVVRNAPLGSPRRLATEWPPAPPLDRPAVVTVAGMYERKGIGDLIAAFAETAASHPDAALYLVGAGPDRPGFETLASAQACAARIHFTGFVADPRPYLAQADVFVLASRREPISLVIPEAREAGCAIVASAADGIPEALDGGRAGILVPPRRPDLLAQAITRLLAHPQERAEWRRRAQENLGWLQLDRAVAETFAIYQEVLGGAALAGEPAAV